MTDRWVVIDETRYLTLDASFPWVVLGCSISGICIDAMVPEHQAVCQQTGVGGA